MNVTAQTTRTLPEVGWKSDALLAEMFARFRVLHLPNDRERVIYETEHQLRVSYLGGVVAQRMGVPNVDECKFGFAVHDAGKAHEDMIPLMKILKSKSYSEEQRSIVRVTHTKLGPEMIRLLERYADFTDLPYNSELVKEICLYHHPEVDAGNTKRSLPVKICAVVDKFDAMISGEDERPHRKPRTIDFAVRNLMQWVDERILDPEVVQVFASQVLKY